MRIVNLNCNIFVQLVNGKPILFVFADNALAACAYEEVFLADSHAFSVFVGIVGIKRIRNKLCI